MDGMDGMDPSTPDWDYYKSTASGAKNTRAIKIKFRAR